MSGRALGAVLAGGRGSRIGGAKALAELGGRPLISYPLAAVEAAGLDPVVVAKRDSELPPLACQVVAEPDQPRHPLCGVVAALRHAEGRPVVAIGCDMPFASAALLAWLGAPAGPALGLDPEPELIAAAPEGVVHPFPAHHAAALLPALEAALAAERPLRATLASLGARLLDSGELGAFGDPHLLCFNVNDAEDLERAELLLRRQV